MAGIDKTYTNNYADYKAFKDWADNQVITFFDGHTKCIGDWVWDYEKEDFNNGEIPIMNTPNWLDAYLLQHCKIEFVLERMKSVYSDEFIKNSKDIDFTSIPHDYRQNRKVRIKVNDYTKFPIHNKPYGGKMKWWLQCDDRFWYNSDTKTWVHSDSFYPYNTNTANIKSIKALVRHLRKQFLPNGVKFTISGRYVGECYSVTVG